MEVIGRVKLIGKVQEFGTNGFKKRELVVTTEEQYPQFILIEFTQDKCSLLDSIEIGELIKVSVNLRGREWVNPQGETKYFNSINGWRIEKLEKENVSESTSSMGKDSVSSASFPINPVNAESDTFENYNEESEDDDLPF